MALMLRSKIDPETAVEALIAAELDVHVAAEACGLDPNNADELALFVTSVPVDAGTLDRIGNAIRLFGAMRLMGAFTALTQGLVAKVDNDMVPAKDYIKAFSEVASAMARFIDKGSPAVVAPMSGGGNNIQVNLFDDMVAKMNDPDVREAIVALTRPKNVVSGEVTNHTDHTARTMMRVIDVESRDPPESDDDD